MLGIVYTGGLLRFEATLVKVEVDVANGLPGWVMVGLPEKAVQEAKERVGSALRNSGIKLEPKKTTINLAPATHKKSGNQYDLPIAIGVLLAHQVLEPKDLSGFLFVGELSLTGELKTIHGALLFAALAREKKFKALVLPKANAREAKLAGDLMVVGCESVAEVLEFLNKGVLPPLPVYGPPIQAPAAAPKTDTDFAEVKGQCLAKRALEIAAAGSHHCLLIGPPGSGKTMLAGSFPSILPPLTKEQSLETTQIYSALGMVDHDNPFITTPPFRSPHHSISYAGLIGGGDGWLTPGEVTLAHNGVLFLDELPEFRRDALQMLRQPLEAGWVAISRAKGRIQMPARFQMIAACNPCRCGYLGHPRRNCTCDPARVLQYRAKISGPLLDRIDLHVEISALNEADLFEPMAGEPSEKIRARVMEARQRQRHRYRELRHTTNALLPAKHFKKFCPLSAEAEKFFRRLFPSLQLSARAHDRILRVARTIADLANAEILETEHIAEAAQYRVLDRDTL